MYNLTMTPVGITYNMKSSLFDIEISASWKLY